RPWRWAYSRDASRSARVSPRVPSGIFTYPSYSNSRITRGGIGAGGFDTDAGGGGVVGDASVGAGPAATPASASALAPALHLEGHGVRWCRRRILVEEVRHLHHHDHYPLR
ncbi:unnamed protein product, partial [Ascophyllum nodosum]